MTELTKPKIIPIENRPQKSKLFLKCVVLPIVIFLIIGKIFSFGAFGYIFFGFDLFWFVIIYYLYQYGNTYFDGMTEQLKRQGETFNYQNRGVWINSQDKTIILFDQPDQRLVKYPFDYITSVGHYNLVEDRFRTTTTVISNPMMGTHVNQQVHRTPMKREFQVNIGTRDQFKPDYSLKVLFPWRSPKMASEIRQLLSADHYQ
ncbi:MULTISPECIES: hypothetical protein [Acinetobacter]|mgnify:FL=1|uniref:Uncharacterized protein n=4 Tax=Acinetobacter TaxID=469 RepID=N9C1E4_9GAMM|nr:MULTISPECIES: hypothetical protein [Acinetobacter]AVN17423.1 hypothetical protein C6N19_05420 [Acinetobacter pittii]AZB98207.1 hypothetical protein DKE45_004485 [Acinetobacter pittii]AZC04039.1 hypothetical protein DKE50_004460 [Acinetobacter nosocomialis]AZC05769.1 hypothetical protein DKE44_004435 [Acinetobacter nosocomialis]ENV40827.1 hypothetical protein F958_01527 [Acinetobacter nosocomialis NIPH 386]